ncbi:MAG: MFS transporter [Selenomonadaceae bacterium]
MTQQRLVFAAVLITSFMGPFMGSSINIAIPSMAVDFGVSAPELSWVVTAYLLGSVSVLVPFGKLADIIGRKYLYKIGTIAVIVMTVLAGAAGSVPLLVGVRFLQGIALAMIFSTGMAMLVSSHTPAERGRVIGYSASVTYIGLSLGPILGGMITQYLGWRMIFFLTAAVLLLSLAAIVRVKNEWYGAKGEKLDYKGSLLYAMGSMLLLYGLSAYASQPIAKYLFWSGVVLFGCFIYQQHRSPAPLLALELFRNTIFAMSNIAAMIHYSSTFAISFLLSLYLQLLRGFDASTAGMLLLLQPCMMALFSPKAGALSDRLQPRLLSSLGMAMTALGLFAFSFLTAETSMVLIGADLLFIGVGFAFFSSPNSNAVMGAVEPRYYGVASSILAVMRLSGQAISMAVVTVLLTVYTIPTVSSAEHLPSLMRGIKVIFLVLSVTCCFGVAASLARGKRVEK